MEAAEMTPEDAEAEKVGVAEDTSSMNEESEDSGTDAAQKTIPVENAEEQQTKSVTFDEKKTVRPKVVQLMNSRHWARGRNEGFGWYTCCACWQGKMRMH